MSNIPANDPSLKSWVDVAPDSDFPIQNLPFGIHSRNSEERTACVAIGDYVVDLNELAHLGMFVGTGVIPRTFDEPYLNEFIAQGKTITSNVRQRISEILREDDPHNARVNSEHFLFHKSQVTMHMPVYVRDYTDFYSSEDHARNVGKMFRDPENALLPNWKHMPVGYHGRASSIVISGTDIRRPMGQTMPQGAEKPIYGPSKLLDFELEVAFVVDRQNMLGEQVTIQEADDFIFGLVLFNDWSARDIQKWEYVPLGPFLGKSFASTVSPWIVTLEALEPFRVDSPVQVPEVLPYLKYEGKGHFDINLEAYIQPENGNENMISRTNLKYLYWNMAQQLAHHTVNGCNIDVGDMCASGTISGPQEKSYGSMLELSWRGTKPIELSDGSERKFLQDGDTVILRGYGMNQGLRIGFGECRGTVVPAED